MGFQQINGMEQFFINADILYQDFKSYNAIKPLIQPNGNLHERAQQHYEEIRTVYGNEVTELLDSHTR